MVSEGIEEGGPLGVWCRAQQSALVSLGLLVEMQTIRIEERAEATERAAQALGDAHEKAIAEARAVTLHLRAQIAENDQSRQAITAQLAGRLSGGIEKSLKDLLVLREIKWNQRQNWRAAAVVAAVMLGCFIGGDVWAGYGREQATLARCVVKQVHDEAGHNFCPMEVVRAGS